MDINDSVRWMVGLVGVWNLAIFVLTSRPSVDLWLAKYGESIRVDRIAWLQPLLAWSLVGIFVPVSIIWFVFAFVFQWEIGGVFGAVGVFVWRVFLVTGIAIYVCRRSIRRFGLVVAVIVLWNIAAPYLAHAVIAKPEPPSSLQLRSDSTLNEIRKLLPDVRFAVVNVGEGGTLGATITNWNTPMILVNEQRLPDRTNQDIDSILWHEAGHLVYRDQIYQRWLRVGVEVLVLTLAFGLARRFSQPADGAVQFVASFRVFAAVAALALAGLLLIALHRQHIELRADAFAVTRVGVDQVASMLQPQPLLYRNILIGVILYPSDAERLRALRP